uniref:Uncharacterized protein n=1 Tax=Candidatus Kentrum sp. DK TaxID=2126562 RepID=A0A450SNZ3_9GAMM|nr:MAG: hypothetical protein BECKDK2373B_GA0170837_105312 [Candidatus Kentron sp. DK]VFJ59700.1 MAG: hypothetical protein BECKDK2373C_GA0170839_10739 [Candidatus Kentron sp. DK]
MPCPYIDDILRHRRARPRNGPLRFLVPTLCVEMPSAARAATKPCYRPWHWVPASLPG